VFPILREALGSVRAHAGRFVLTALGVAWGGFMLTFLSALLGGMNEHFRSELEEIGPRMVYMGTGTIMKNRVGERASRDVELEVEDIIHLDRLASVEFVSPDVGMWNQVVRAGSRTKLLSVMGWNAAGPEMRNFKMASGRSFTPLEVERAARVAVLGPDAKERLFGAAPAIGKNIRIASHRFRVIGISVAKGEQLVNGDSRDDLLVMVPYTAAQRFILKDERVYEWIMQPPSRELGWLSILRAREVVALHEGFDPSLDSALWANDFWDSFQVFYGMFFAIQLFYVVAGVVTLFVGAIGVMNIMLVVVGERTAEIGLRKAIGASQRDVFVQFVLEAVVVALSAGIAGTALGWAAVRLLAAPMAATGIVMPATPDPMTSIAVSAALAGVAIVAGLVPAIRAARVPPSEALRAF
jgi:putative ABC transport system permease protein